ncbi:MAG TPA: hypothetical protein VM364_00850 [Vicinamibacterales bacterium]|nr:hypothetical protein [Vicinamibacterales bacterium]
MADKGKPKIPARLPDTVQRTIVEGTIPTPQPPPPPRDQDEKKS